MKIIKQGDYITANRIIKFSCENCGCVFEAGKNEYAEYYECKNKVRKVRAIIFCPCCGRMVHGSYNVSAKYCYVTRKLCLHQNDRCKRFTLF